MIEDTSPELIGAPPSDPSSSNLSTSLSSTQSAVSDLGDNAAPNVNHKDEKSTDNAGEASNESSSSSLIHSNTETPNSSNASAPARRSAYIKTIVELEENHESDFFVQCFIREDCLSQKGDPYLKLSFRDCTSQITAMIWNNNPLFSQCYSSVKIGSFYKIRGSVQKFEHGISLRIRRIREAVESDREDGFEPHRCQPCSLQNPEELLNELRFLATTHIGEGPLLDLIQVFFDEYESILYELPASRAHHHCTRGGLLEHTLSVTQLVLKLAKHYLDANAVPADDLSIPLIVAGSILHDIGKLSDTDLSSVVVKKKTQGFLLGHQVLAIKLIGEIASEVGLESNTQVLLEHIILSHQRFSDWETAIPPMTLEAMLVHYADYIDSTFNNALKLISEDVSQECITRKKGPFNIPLLKTFPNETHSEEESPINE